jgi:hypothetical protein
MLEADYSTTAMAHEGTARDGRQMGDETLLVKFFTKPRQDQTKSAEEGRPIYVDTTYIQIMQPGNKDSIIERPASEMDKARFPRHYRAFKDRTDGEEYIEGTRLSEWPGITRSQAEELRFFNIQTIEQLLAASDSNVQKIMGISLLKKRAQAFLEASEAESAAAYAAEKDAQMEAMAQQLAALQAKVEAYEAAEEELED